MTRVMFFHAPWCHGCAQMVAPFNMVKNELEDDDFKFYSYDVEEDEGNDLSCKYQVRNVPTVLVVNKDRVIDRIAGSRSYNELSKELRKWK